MLRRYFETESYEGLPGRWWFGGGSDITPSYVFEEDMKHFHGTYKVLLVANKAQLVLLPRQRPVDGSM